MHAPFKRLLHTSSSHQQNPIQRQFPLAPIHFDKPVEQGKPLKPWTPAKDRLSPQELVRQLYTLPVNPEIKNKIKDLLNTHNYEIANAIFALPWNIKSDDNFNLNNAKSILDKDHYGMEKTKDHILDLLAIQKLNKNKRHFLPVWCLVGSPGVGKTALCKSIALSMGKKYARVAMGGVKDESIIRGWEPSYKSAGPGRIMQAIQQAGTCNPLITLDEIDKMDSDSNAQASLLELFDPEQNTTFRDHYLGVPFDVSKVFFVATANYIARIPAPLKDRMEIITLADYTLIDKIHIAKNHLIKKACNETGLSDHGKTILLNDETIQELIANYTDEAGVRNLERCFKTLAAKTARALVEGKPQPFFTKDNLKEYLKPMDHGGHRKKIGF